MIHNQLIFSIFLIFAGAAICSTLALWTKQSMLVAYIALGALIGPWGLKLLHDTQTVNYVSDVGILFLLFLLGLSLPPQKLLVMLKKVTGIALLSSVGFAGLSYILARAFGYSASESWVIGAAMMFSSTIIGIKLLPTTVLHHQHTGEVMISILLFQDLIAILILLLLHSPKTSSFLGELPWVMLLKLPTLLIFSYLFQRFILSRLFFKFNRIKEYLFLLSIAWCLSLSELSIWLGLSANIGAFIAGVSLASSPIAIFVSESLKPIRDFFLIIFFFSIGATFNMNFLSVVLLPSLVLLAVLLLAKSGGYRVLLGWVGEKKSVAWEVGIRLAQISEFSLIIAYTALESHFISAPAAYLIEAVTILSFIVSSYWVVLRYPTPVALTDRLRRD